MELPGTSPPLFNSSNMTKSDDDDDDENDMATMENMLNRKNSVSSLSSLNDIDDDSSDGNSNNNGHDDASNVDRDGYTPGRDYNDDDANSDDYGVSVNEKNPFFVHGPANANIMPIEKMYSMKNTDDDDTLPQSPRSVS